MTLDLLKYTEKLCQIPSVSSDLEQLHKVIDFIVTSFAQYNNSYIQKIVYQGKPSLIVQNFEWKHADIILNWHIDVVPPSEENQFEPYEKDGKLYCRWAWDMKAGIAILVKVMQDVLEQGFISKKITLMISSDEEIWGNDGVKYLLEQWYTWDIVLIPDWWATNSIVHAQKWLYLATIEASWVACHSSRPWLWENALHNIVNFFQVLRDEIQDTYAIYHTNEHWGNSTNLNIVQWWTAINAVPNKATAHIDVRFIEWNTVETIRKKILWQMPSFKCTLIKEIAWELLYTEPNNKILQSYVKIASQVLWEQAILEKEHWASDGRFFASKWSTIIIHRPTCENIHWKDESVVIEDINTVYEIYKQFVFSQ